MSQKSKQTAPVEEGPLDLARVLSEELKHVRPDVVPTGKKLEDVLNDLHEAKLTALCFSGGGIRSATFGLGIVQALAKNKLLTRFDYLSTVSGGGYLGSWLSAWIYRVAEPDAKTGKRQINTGEEAVEDRDLGIHRVQAIINCRPIDDGDKPNPEPTQLQHLREFSNYMSPRTGLLSTDTWTLGTIYLRNLFLNLTIFIPLLAAVLILPRILFRSVGNRNVIAEVQFAMLVIAVISGACAIAFVIGRLPSQTSRAGEEGTANYNESLWRKVVAFANTDAGVLLFGVLPLVLAAFLTTTLVAWSYQNAILLTPKELPFLPIDGYPEVVRYVGTTTLAFLLGLSIFRAFRKFRNMGWFIAAAIPSSFLGGLLLYVTTTQVFPWIAGLLTTFAQSKGSSNWAVYVAVAVPVFLVLALVSAAVFVGLLSREMTDEDREWLARYGALVMTIAAVWLGLNALVLLGPLGVEWVFSLHRKDPPSLTNGWALISTVTAIVSGAVTLIGGFSGKSQVRSEGIKTKTSKFLDVAPRIAAVVFFVAILLSIAYFTTPLLYAVGNVISGGAADSVFPKTYAHLDVLSQSKAWFLLATLGVLTVVGTFMACFVNVNKFSLHGAYRDRLVRAYLGASNKGRKQNTFTGFDDGDNLELHSLSRQRPLHVLNATVNLVGGKTLAWQNRKAASFTMSPLHCGSWAVKGYRRSKGYCYGTGSKRSLRLGTAMAISGAAANPNMGYYSSSIVTFLMSLVNLRLGWWLGNTGKPGSKKDLIFWNRRAFWTKESPSIAIWPLINETLGRTDETKKFLNVSDGGHFENLALYEMVLRRCHLIVLSDGAADESFKFGEIANAIQKCKVDLGVDIKFLGSMNIRSRNEPEAGGVKRSRFALAEIVYPEKDENGKNRRGWLLYTRPTFYKTSEPRDIITYADSNPNFPHQSTGDQMYDEKQFEAYRGLGFLSMMEIQNIFQATALGDPKDEVDDDLESLFAKNTDMGDTLFGFFGVGDSEKYEKRKSRLRAVASAAPWIRD